MNKKELLKGVAIFGLVLTSGCMSSENPEYSLDNYQFTANRVRKAGLFPDYSLAFTDLDHTGPGSVGSTSRIIATIDELCGIKPGGIRRFGKGYLRVIETVFVKTERTDCLEIIKNKASAS